MSNKKFSEMTLAELHSRLDLAEEMMKSTWGIEIDRGRILHQKVINEIWSRV